MQGTPDIQASQIDMHLVMYVYTRKYVLTVLRNSVVKCLLGCERIYIIGIGIITIDYMSDWYYSYYW